MLNCISIVIYHHKHVHVIRAQGWNIDDVEIIRQILGIIWGEHQVFSVTFYIDYIYRLLPVCKGPCDIIQHKLWLCRIYSKDKRQIV